MPYANRRRRKKQGARQKDLRSAAKPTSKNAFESDEEGDEDEDGLFGGNSLMPRKKQQTNYDAAFNDDLFGALEEDEPLPASSTAFKPNPKPKPAGTQLLPQKIPSMQYSKQSAFAKQWLTFFLR